MSRVQAIAGTRFYRRLRVHGHVFVVSSPSGGGKTTVVERLRQTVPRLVRSVSVTTRAARAGEREGCDYRFVSATAFAQLKRAGALLEWARVHGAWYGTPKRPVFQALSRGKDVILSIDVQGGRKIRKALGARAILIFLMPPSMHQLRQRLLARRTETPKALRTRLRAAWREVACAAWYDHVVVNDRLSQAVASVKAILMATRNAQHGERLGGSRKQREDTLKNGAGAN